MGSIRISFILVWFSHFFMDFFTGIWPIYKTLAQINPFEAGMIMGIAGFLGELLQVGFGYLSDRGHRKKILLLGLCLASAIIWVTFVEGVYNYFWLLLLLMLGSAAFHPAATGMAGILSRQNKGRGILFFASGGAIGFAISQLVFTHLIGIFNGHALIVLVPLSLCIAAIAIFRFPLQDAIKPTVSLKEFFQPLLQCRKPLFLLYFSQISSQLLVSSLLFLLPDILIAKGCHSWLCFGGGHFCYVLGSACTMIPAGYLADKYGQKPVMLTALSISIGFLYLMLATSSLSIGWTIGLLICLGGFLGPVNPVIVSWGNRLVPESPSTVSALLMGFAWCFGNLGCACAGAIAPHFLQNSIAMTLSIMGLFLGAAFILTLFVPHITQEKKLNYEG